MDWTDWLRTVFALLATLALIGGAAYIARRFGMLSNITGKTERRLVVSESLMLDPRRRLVVVRFDERDHLILLSPTRDLLVTDVPAKISPAAEPSPAETTT